MRCLIILAILFFHTPVAMADETATGNIEANVVDILSLPDCSEIVKTECIQVVRE